jgi:hypothetical protein
MVFPMHSVLFTTTNYGPVHYQRGSNEGTYTKGGTIMAKSKKLPIAMKKEVDALLEKKINKITNQQYKELEESNIDWIPEAKQVWTLLKDAAKALHTIKLTSNVG